MTEWKIKIKFDEFLAGLPKTSEGEYLVSEDNVDRYIVDMLNEAGIKAEMIYQDTDYKIFLPEYQVSAFITLLSLSDEPTSELIKALMYFSDEVNSSEELESWYTYADGESYLHIKESRHIAQPEEKKE